MTIRPILIVAVWLGLAAAGAAQAPLTAGETARANRLFAAKQANDSLQCHVDFGGGVLDYAFRYEAWFTISAPVGQFDGAGPLVVFLRVTPLGHSPTLLGTKFSAPPIASVNPKDLNKADLDMSGGFVVGEGQYSAELLLVDSHSRSCRTRRSFKTARHDPRGVPPTLKPNTVAPIDSEVWDGKMDPRGVRLTVLLNSIPTDQNGARLDPWDRGLLLQTLALLLREVPAQSVRVVAFDIRRQQEVFHDDRFDREGFARLAVALQPPQGAALPYQALMPNAPGDFLTRFTLEQLAGSAPPEVVIFLGPVSNFYGKVPLEVPRLPETRTRLFYFQYQPAPSCDAHPEQYPRMQTDLERLPPCTVLPWMPDTIEFLTSQLHGTVFKFHNPHELALAVPRLLSQLKP